MQGDTVFPLLLLGLGVYGGPALALGRRLQKRALRGGFSGSGALALGGLGLGLYMRFVEPYWLETTETVLPWAGPDLRVTVLADFHVGRSQAWIVRRSVEAANATHPDVVLLAGDYIAGYEATPDRLAILRELRALRAHHGVYAVMGNHDSEPYVDETPRSDALTNFLTGLGFHVLRNANARPVPGVTVVGLDEVLAERTDAARAQAGATPGDVRIVLTHNWRALRARELGPFALAVAGHSHGGQVCVPFTTICPLVSDTQPYLRGLYAWPSGGRLFVNRGIGESEALARLGSRPEVSLLRLVHSPPGR
ncbi:MAG: metallophosphoesterase family protein [Deltaproteobacteria bacterium]|nr:metallophosphoesterase family protein [Deltaproteobacteria bacterium]